MPWAETAETSFVETPATYRRLLGKAGFKIEREENRRAFVLEAGARDARERAAARGAPPLGIHVLIGPGLATSALAT